MSFVLYFFDRCKILFAKFVIVRSGNIRTSGQHAKQTPCLSESQVKSISDFEQACMAVKHNHCRCCRSVSMNIKINKNGICRKCALLGDVDYHLKKNHLPVWHDENGCCHHEVPDELKSLSIAEMMLIQRCSPYIRLVHIKNGTFGLAGHVCAFEQDISEFADVLPRASTDAHLVKVFQSLRSELDGDDNHSKKKMFKVRPRKIHRALIFLKAHNSEFSDIKIDMKRLDWITGDEGYLDNLTLVRHDSSDVNADLGPARQQCIDPGEVDCNLKVLGTMDDHGSGCINPADTHITSELQNELAMKGIKCDGIDWPRVSELPINEYGSVKLFARSFPWLFPGGVGDIKDYDNPEQAMAEWGRMLLYFEDGRFAADKMFTFFCLNYIVRHRNTSSGGHFIDKFISNPPSTLDELKSKIRNGDTSFLHRLSYYNKRIKGSGPYWHQKRCELYSWISQHVQLGHGAPTFFITLSCAEYFWPDVVRLLEERLQIAGIDTSDMSVGSASFVRMCNDYTVVIQEYFQIRVKLWLETVGKDVFDIGHYWVRYEFAPSRGQIHAHLLAITNDKEIHHQCYQELRKNDGGNGRAQLLAQLAETKFVLTACVNDGFDSISTDCESSPVARRFQDVSNSSSEMISDGQQLLKFCQLHQCSGYCLRDHGGKR